MAASGGETVKLDDLSVATHADEPTDAGMDSTAGAGATNPGLPGSEIENAGPPPIPRAGSSTLPDLDGDRNLSTAAVPTGTSARSITAAEPTGRVGGKGETRPDASETRGEKAHGVSGGECTL